MKAKLIVRKYPDIEADLYCAAVAVHDELTLLFDKEEPLNNTEVIRMKELINLLLLVRKSTRPNKQKDNSSAVDEQAAAHNEDIF